MAASHSRVGDEEPPNASATRREGEKEGRPPPSNGGIEAREKRKTNRKDEEIRKLLQKLKEMAEGGLQLQDEATPAGVIFASMLETACQLEVVVRGALEAVPGNPTEDRILQRLEAIEKKLAAQPTAKPALTNGPQTWSQIAAKGTTGPAKIELRMDNMEGADEETSQERLEKVRKVIPEAKGIVPHPRNKNKVSVVLPNEATKERILRDGIEDDAAIKVIRRPHLVMIMGVSKDSPIKNMKCEENDAWISATTGRNPGIQINRVGWVYNDKELKKRRENPATKKGSLIISVPTVTMQQKLIKNGIFVGPEWHPTRLWDVALMDGQCFKCWRWGHHQSVCNQAEERCGHCAGAHPTNNCQTTEDSEASCTACKRKGHKAWMTGKCPEFQKFKDRSNKLKERLQMETDCIRWGPPTGHPGFTFSSQVPRTSSIDADGFTVVESLGKKRKVGKPSGISTAATAPGQMRINLGGAAFNSTQ